MAGQHFPQQQTQQQPQLFDASCYRRLRQALLDIGVRPELAAKFTDDDLGLLLREGFQDAEDVQDADAAALQRAGLRASRVSFIVKAQQRAAAAQHNGVAVPGCGVADQGELLPLAQDLNGPRDRDQLTSGGFPSASTTKWWHGWLPSTLLRVSQSQSQPVSGSMLSCEAVAALPLTSAVPEADAAEMDVPSSGSSSSSAAAAASPQRPQHQLGSCRRRHIHRPAPGQERTQQHATRNGEG